MNAVQNMKDMKRLGKDCEDKKVDYTHIGNEHRTTKNINHVCQTVCLQQTCPDFTLNNHCQTSELLITTNNKL